MTRSALFLLFLIRLLLAKVNRFSLNFDEKALADERRRTRVRQARKRHFAAVFSSSVYFL